MSVLILNEDGSRIVRLRANFACENSAMVSYATLILRYANPQKAGPYLMAKLRNLTETCPQKHDLDTLIGLLFRKT